MATQSTGHGTRRFIGSASLLKHRAATALCGNYIPTSAARRVPATAGGIGYFSKFTRYMHPFEATLPTPAENLALDEALLEWAEETEAREDYLRLWESPEPMVVVGRLIAARTRSRHRFLPQPTNSNPPSLQRRPAIVAGPGCLMYAVVLSYAKHVELKDITRAHAYILKQLTTALGPHSRKRRHSRLRRYKRPGVAARNEQRGTRSIRSCSSPSPLLAPRSSLLSPRKFSGNSLRVKRTHLLYHGTLLYDFDLSLIAKCLRTAAASARISQRPKA